MSRLLGIDVGDKKIGLAMADTTVGLAFARPALLVSDWAVAWPILRDLILDEQIDRVIVGMPLGKTGQIGSQAERTQQFITELKTVTTAPIETRDERFSSQAVKREQTTAGRTLQRGQEDSLAAQLLLESYLEEHRS